MSFQNASDNPSYVADGDEFVGKKGAAVNHDVEDSTGADGVKKGKMTKGKVLVVVCILVTEMCERLTYYGVLANMVLFGTSVLKFSSTESANVSTIFSGVVYLFPVVGGLISDAWAGKFRTIIASGFLYLLGLVLLPMSAFHYRTLFGEYEDDSYYDITVVTLTVPGNTEKRVLVHLVFIAMGTGGIKTETRRGLFLSSLVFIAMGTGGIKANVGPFGAQQVEDLGEDAIKSFFNWFYWFINVGSLIAYTGVAYIQQNISFTWGFVIPLASMVVAIILFVLAKPFYVQKPPGGSVLSVSLAVIWQVMTGKKAQVPPGEKSRYFDKARIKYGGSYDDATVESVKAVLRIMPVFLTIIMYWALYSQMTSTIFLQGERMDLSAGSIKIPASGLNAFNTIIIILLIPVVDRLLYPCMEKIGRPLTHLQRIGIGFLLVALSMVAAGVIEIARKDRMTEPGGTITQELGEETFVASTLSVFTQVPAYALVGASEVFASVCGLEFAYTQAPKSMQGLLTGLFFVTSGLGGFVATGILNAVKAATKDDPWFADEINDAHFEYYFFLLGGLMFLDFLIFLLIAYFYRYRNTQYDEIEDEVGTGDKTGDDDTHF